MTERKTQAVQEKGSPRGKERSFKEDGFFAFPPFWGVIDGYSAPYNTDVPPIYFGSFSGGEMVKNLIIETFREISHYFPLSAVITSAIAKIRGQQIAQKGILERADCLAGASFAFAKENPEGNIHIIQGGDSFCCWKYKTGETGCMPNQAFEAVMGNLKSISEILQRNGNNKKEMWKEFLPELKKQRIRDINNRLVLTGYASLNGQFSAQRAWAETTIPRKELDYLLFFTDGLFPGIEGYKLTQDAKYLAKLITSKFEEGGIEGLVAKARKRKELEEFTHEGSSEITIMQVPFR